MRVQIVAAQSVDEFTRRLDTAACASLAIVFAGCSHDQEAIRAACADRGLQAFGASSAGEIADGSILDEGIAATLLDLPADSFVVRAFPSSDHDMLALGREIGAWAKTTFRAPALLLHQSGTLSDGEALLNGIREASGATIPVFGGRAATSGDVLKTWSFDHRTVLPQGAVVLALDTDRIRVEGGAAAGWKPIGTPKTVTRAAGNTVYELDGRPALEVISRYLPIERDIVQVSPQHPLHIVRPDGRSVLRSPMLWNKEDGSVSLAGSVPEGSLCSFTVAAGQGIKDATVAETARLRGQVESADLLLLYSCLGRLMALGPIIEDEVGGVCAAWGAPALGFFTFGEFGVLGGTECDFHNNTCVIVALSGPSTEAEAA